MSVNKWVDGEGLVRHSGVARPRKGTQSWRLQRQGWTWRVSRWVKSVRQRKTNVLFHLHVEPKEQTNQKETHRHRAQTCQAGGMAEVMNCSNAKKEQEILRNGLETSSTML